VLQRTTLTPPLSHPESSTAPAQVAHWLPYFLILMALTSAVACAFVWQANIIRDIQRDTYAMGGSITALERDNARLMMELAVFDSPAAIERESARLGLVPEISTVVHVAPEYPASPVEAAGIARLPARLAGWVTDLARRAGLGGNPAPGP